MWIRETRGPEQKWKKLSMLKQQGKEKSNIINSSLLKKNMVCKLIVFTEAVFLELSAVWCFTEGLGWLFSTAAGNPRLATWFTLETSINQESDHIWRTIKCRNHETRNYSVCSLWTCLYSQVTDHVTLRWSCDHMLSCDFFPHNSFGFLHMGQWVSFFTCDFLTRSFFTQDHIFSFVRC